MSKIYLYENDKLCDLEFYSGKEVEALEDAIHNLLKDNYRYDIDMFIGYIENIDNDFRERFSDSNIRYQIFPPQYGLSPWSNKVEVSFKILTQEIKIS